MTTWEETYSYAQEWIGTPYALGGEGTKPGQPVDCSRYVQEVMGFAGIPFTRTTWTQWDDTRYSHEPPGNPQPGWIAYFHVSGDAGPDPQHVGICVGGGQMIEAPRTGEDVKITAIPNTPQEYVIGYIVPPYGAVIPPTPVPPIPPLPGGAIPMDIVQLSNGNVAISAIGAGPNAGHALLFVANPADFTRSVGVLDMTDNIGPKGPNGSLFTVSS